MHSALRSELARSRRRLRLPAGEAGVGCLAWNASKDHDLRQEERLGRAEALGGRAGATFPFPALSGPTSCDSPPPARGTRARASLSPAPARERRRRGRSPWAAAPPACGGGAAASASASRRGARGWCCGTARHPVSAEAQLAISDGRSRRPAASSPRRRRPHGPCCRCHGHIYTHRLARDTHTQRKPGGSTRAPAFPRSGQASWALSSVDRSLFFDLARGDEMHRPPICLASYWGR